MRIILSEGQVNIFNLAKNAGTSVKRSLLCVDGAQPKSIALASISWSVIMKRLSGVVVPHENLLSLSGIETKRSN